MKHNETEHSTTDGTVKENDKPNSSKQLIERIAIEDSPFTAVRIEQEWHILLGKYRLNNTPFKTLEEVQEDAKDASWHRIMQVVGVMIEEHFVKQPTSKIMDLTKTNKPN